MQTAALFSALSRPGDHYKTAFLPQKTELQAKARHSEMVFRGRVIWIIFWIATIAEADLTGTDPEPGTCICLDANGVNVRDSGRICAILSR